MASPHGAIDSDEEAQLAEPVSKAGEVPRNPAPPASDEPDLQHVESVRAVLEQLNLGQYAEKLVAVGYGDVWRLGYLTEKELMAVGQEDASMKQGHAFKFARLFHRVAGRMFPRLARAVAEREAADKAAAERAADEAAAALLAEEMEEKRVKEGKKSKKGKKKGNGGGGGAGPSQEPEAAADAAEEAAAAAEAAELAAALGREPAWVAGAEAREARHAEALLAEEEAEKEAEGRDKGSKKGKKKKKKKKGEGGGGGAGPSREPEEKAEEEAAAEPEAAAAALEESVRLDDEARRAAEEQAPPAESAGNLLPSEEQEQTAAALSLADANFNTGRAAVPESSMGGETTCIICFTRPKTHAAGPCGHQCACGPCSERLKLCPYCREPVVMWIATRIV